MSNEKMREEFRRIVGIDWLEGAEVCKIWQLAWQASRAAIEVDLSTLTVTHDTDTNHEPCGDDLFYEDEVKTLIESLGLKVKP